MSFCLVSERRFLCRWRCSCYQWSRVPLADEVLKHFSSDQWHDPRGTADYRNTLCAGHCWSWQGGVAGSGVTAGGQGQESWCSSLWLKAWCLPVLVRVPLERTVLSLVMGQLGLLLSVFPLSSSACPGVRLSGHKYIQAKFCSFFFCALSLFTDGQCDIIAKFLKHHPVSAFSPSTGMKPHMM